MSTQPSLSPIAAPSLVSPSDSTEPEGGAQSFLLKLGRALHRRGIPAHRLEEALGAVCSKLGVTASFFSTPTALFASFENEDTSPDVHLMRVTAAALDLGKLSELDEVSTAVVQGEIPLDEGMARIDAIDKAPMRYGRAVITACYAVNSAAATVFFQGGLREVWVALVIGLVTGLLSNVGSASGKGWRAFEPVAAFSGAVIATLAALWFGPVSAHVAVLSGLIALVPGYTLVVSIFELANGHLASGSARITAAFLIFLTLSFGVAFGTKSTELMAGVAPTIDPQRPLPAWALAVALVVAAFTFALIFGVKLRDVPYVIGVSALGFYGARFGSSLFGPELGAFVGALAAGGSSNLYARVLRRPAVVTLFPGIMLLVPGSIGFRSLSSLLAHDVVSGVQTAFTSILVAVALVAGLLLANDIVRPRRAL